MRERLVELRNILLDRPSTALETGVWWTEYVLRHKDLSHLRAASFDQYWFQRRLIDVWAFLFSIVFICLVLLCRILAIVLKYIGKVITGGSSGGHETNKKWE